MKRSKTNVLQGADSEAYSFFHFKDLFPLAGVGIGVNLCKETKH
jgi:hypothetical protein